VPLATGLEATTIIIFRPSAFVGIIGSTPFSIDQCRIESLWNDQYAVYKLPSGKHRIAAERHPLAIGGDGVITGSFDAGKTYYLHYSMSVGSPYYAPSGLGFTTSTNFYIVPKEQALRAMPKLIEVR
jgi:hypothetical protein